MIKAYLRHRRALFILYLCVVIFFPLIHFLSGAKMASMAYSILVLTFLLALGIVMDFVRFRKRICQIREIRANLSAFNHTLPDGAGPIEDEYAKIITQLYDMIEASRFETEKRHTEQTEYYTMWIHQIKTPISAMRLALQSADYDPVIEQELFKIEQYAEMALQYAKLGHIESDLVIREYRLSDIVKDSVRKYATLFIYKKLSVEIGDIYQVVLTDSKWLSFIIEQLLSNSIKYTNQGSITISTNSGCLVIKDTGIGIRPEDTERIFEKGYTGYNGRIDKKASGIGLYMAKKVADKLSIGIRITSEVGEGTTAILTFPERIETDSM